jgi:hypothetical protein
MYPRVRRGHITRIEEYLDSGTRAVIKAAREALYLGRPGPISLYIAISVDVRVMLNRYPSPNIRTIA